MGRKDTGNSVVTHHHVVFTHVEQLIIFVITAWHVTLKLTRIIIFSSIAIMNANKLTKGLCDLQRGRFQIAVIEPSWEI
jgi:hypothetical protein